MDVREVDLVSQQFHNSSSMSSSTIESKACWTSLEGIIVWTLLLAPSSRLQTSTLLPVLLFKLCQPFSVITLLVVLQALLILCSLLFSADTSLSLHSLHTPHIRPYDSYIHSYLSLLPLMTAHSRGPIEVFSSKRRASTANSTGLDYSSCYRVEEDILSRIRSLLLSRNDRCPPRTPYISEEDHNRHSEHCGTSDTSDPFDFSTAQSVTRLLVRTESGGFGFPISHLRSRSATSKMDVAHRPTQSSGGVQRRSLRTTSSANDLSAPLDDTALHAEFLPCCPPCPPGDAKKTFGLPRLVLREKRDKKKRDPNFRSCIDFNPRAPLADDALLKSPDIPVNQNPKEADPSRRLSGKTVKAEAADLACFLAGCGPGECQKHLRGSSQYSVPVPAPLLINKSRSASPRRPTLVNISPPQKSPASSVFSLDAFPHVAQSQEMEARAMAMQSLSSVVTNFSLPGRKAKSPQRRNAAQREQGDMPLPENEDSNTVKPSDASLSGIAKSASTMPSDPVQPKNSDAPLRSKPYSPSLRSVASKTESIRHSLLKHPVSDAEVVETALPLPPVLTREDVGGLDTAVADNSAAEKPKVATDVPKKATLDNPANEERIKIKAFVVDQNPGAEVVVQLTSLKKAKDLMDMIKERTSETAEGANQSIFPRDESSATIVQHPSEALKTPGSGDNVDAAAEPMLKSITSLKELLGDPESVAINSKEDSKRPQCCPDNATEAPRNISGPELENAAYWGFVPAVKEAVQEAVQVAVRKAVQAIVVPPGIRKDETYGAYRKVVGESLAEAAKDADHYLREASLCNDPSSTIRDQSKDTLEFPESKAAGREALVAGTGPRGEEHGRSDNVMPTGPATLENLETIPLETVDERLVENHKQGWKHSSAWKGVGKKRSSGYTAIPTRSSSKNRVSSTNHATLNSSVKESSKDQSQKRSADGRRTKLRSISSIASAKSFGSSGKGPQGPLDEQESIAQGPTHGNAYRRLMKEASTEGVGRRKTLHWLRELLSTNGPYETRLTALPPRTRRDENSSTGRFRSQTAPVMPVAQLYLGATPKPGQLNLDISSSGDIRKATGEGDVVIPIPEEEGAKTIAITQTFAKTINDLESLLNEALFIARQAAEKEDTGYAPKLLARAAAILKGGRKENEDKVPKSQTVEARSRPSRYNQQRSGSGVASMHESFGSFSSSDSDGSDDGEDKEQDKSQQTPIPELPNVGIKDVNPFTAENVGSGRKISQVSPTKRNRSTAGRRSRQTASCLIDDLDLPDNSSKARPGILSMPPITPRGASMKKAGKQRLTRTDQEPTEAGLPVGSVPDKQEEDIPDPAQTGGMAKPDLDHDHASSISKSFDGSQSEAVQFDTGFAHRQHSGQARPSGGGRGAVELRDRPNSNLPQVTQRGGKGSNLFNLSGRNHISLRGEHHKGFSFARTHKKPKIARDWAPARKRFVATVACVSTALVGVLVGVYAAEVPAIQYWIVDFHHYTILGNVFFFIGLSIPTFFFWPLPLLHGRKPYTLGAMSLAMPLLFPQALAVGQFRSPYVDYWRVGLILPRALMGFVLGFANMNFKATLLDLFGASLQSENPHQEAVDENDVRRHGGGLGVWLGIWTWCAMGSIGIGFLFGALIINHANPAWGFYISIAIIAGVLFLNVLCPEVRRSAFRRSVAEMKHEDGVSRRLGRGEVKMHMVQTGPRWWGEEFHYGVKLNAKMLRQPGFMVMAVYVSWIYGQVVLLVVVSANAPLLTAANKLQLLGSLVSNAYKFKSPYVGASVMALPIGAFLAIPFQKASLFSRSRGNAELDDDNAETLNRKVTLSSHLVRRAIFILCLPFTGMAYTLSSKGPPTPFIVPIIFAGLFGFLSNLAMGECHGIIMETFDTSDLQPGMTGRPRSGSKANSKVTNYSSFPRVSSGLAITQGIGYLIAAVATGVGGVATRNIGQQAATGVMAGILLILSLLLLGVLYRFRDVQIIPNSKQADMQKWKNARRTSAILRAEGVEQGEEWRPVIIGNPTHIMRRMCILEMGAMTRWSEIRRKNHLVDQNTLEAKHPNLAVIRDVEHRIKAAEEEIVHQVRRSISRHSLSRNSSRRSKRSDQSNDQPGDLGGHREMLRPSGKGSGQRKRGKSRIEE